MPTDMDIDIEIFHSIIWNRTCVKIRTNCKKIFLILPVCKCNGQWLSMEKCVAFWCKQCHQKRNNIGIDCHTCIYANAWPHIVTRAARKLQCVCYSSENVSTSALQYNLSEHEMIPFDLNENDNHYNTFILPCKTSESNWWWSVFSKFSSRGTACCELCLI